MNEKYFPTEIEERQQQRWAEAKVFEANVDESKPHTHAEGEGHHDAKPAAKPSVDESKPHDHPPGSEH